MKYVKMLGLLAVAAAALMAFAGVASATTITAPAGTLYTGTIHATSEGHVSLHNDAADIECNSTVAGNITAHGGNPTVDASGPITTLDFTNCTGGWHVTVNSTGTLTAKTGTLFSSGATVTALYTPLGITCRYKTENTDIGNVTNAPKATGHAIFHISAAIPFHGGSFFCGGETAQWTGTYKVNTPTGLTID